MTSIPLLTHVSPTNYYRNHPDWYTGSDVMRFIEPIGGVLLNFAVFHTSGVFKQVQTPRTTACIFIFFLGIALYGQGAGFHSSANMYKNALETIDYDDGAMKDLHFYMRVIWEHAIGHYIYAIGYVLMNACQAFAYRGHKAGVDGLNWSATILMISSSVVFSLLLAAVAIDFPSGTIVGIVYLILYGFCGIGGYLFYLKTKEEDHAAFTFGGRPILHHFLLSYFLALLIIIAWIIFAGGFKSRSQAGVL